VDTIIVENGPVRLNVKVAGDGPLIVCVHGWPELSYSWRHQIDHFSNRGYRVAALDVRGYGGSSKPPDVASYMIRALASDVAAVIGRLTDGSAIVFGHDWGAPITWMTAQLHPGKVSAVALLSVPFIPQGDQSFLDMVRGIFADRFFYQLYFQRQGVAEAELEADVRTALRKIYFALSGSAKLNQWLSEKPVDAPLLAGLDDPAVFPEWMSERDLQVYVDAFKAGGFRGPINRYRAQDMDFQDLRSLAGQPLTQPSAFVGGQRDMVRAFIPGMDLYADPGAACTDFRGSTIVPGVGHWVQQEAPSETNRALEEFLASLRQG
jgi:pimeloyl-ACP methyl ester carboxylesterase